MLQTVSEVSQEQKELDERWARVYLKRTDEDWNNIAWLFNTGYSLLINNKFTFTALLGRKVTAQVCGILSIRDSKFRSGYRSSFQHS